MRNHHLVLLLVSSIAGCAGPRALPPDAGAPPDAGGATDGSVSPEDARVPIDAALFDGGDQADAGTDGGLPPEDAGEDAGTDAGEDAGTDAGLTLACEYVSASSTSVLLMYTFTGGSFASYGCAPIDPTYWMSGAGMSVTITFAAPQSRPSIRVWGMNTDDTASVSVNGAAYSLDTTTASLAPKVVCGLSPGPDGVAFSGGLLTGANTGSEGNYSYQDVTLETSGVTTITVTGQSGSGWGFVGASACTSGPI